MHAFDIIILLVFSIMIYLGMTKGLVQTLFSFMRLGIASAITFFYHGQFKVMLVNMTSLDQVINDFVVKRIANLGGVASETTVNMVDLEIMKLLPMPKFLRDEVTKRLTEGLSESVSNYSNSVVAALSDMVLSFVAIVLLFIIVTLILVALSGFINTLTNLPVIKSFNKLGGAVLGAFNGYLISSVILISMIALNTMFSITLIQGALEDSVIYHGLMEYNIFVILKKLMFIGSL